MYRLITESLLGLQVDVDRLRFMPCIPPAWKSFKVHYRYRETFYHITINNPTGGLSVVRVTLDGTSLSDTSVLMVDDRKPHNVEVELGEPPRVAAPAPLPISQEAVTK